ncbi:MAG: substrate-binding domain-containing protein [Vulcanimicrobiaceae bacterium]
MGMESISGMPVSIKDVARAAGVSPATVSRALGDGPVRAAVRLRVEAAVAATGYRPNLSARRLRSQHSRTIGLIVADIRNPFFTAVSRAVEDVAYRAGLRVILCNTDEDPTKEALYLDLMAEERVTGVIFAPTRLTTQQIARDERAFPIVLIDRALPALACDAVLLDNRAAAGLLVEHLYTSGRRRIAGCFGASSATGIERRDGYLAAMQRLGLPARTSMIAHGIGATEAEVTRILASEDPPDAIVASNGVMLLSVVRAVNAARVAIPQRVAIAGFDNEPWTEFVAGGITVIEQPVDGIGRAAMAMLMDRLADATIARRTIVLDGRCVVRASTARADALPN